MMRIRTTALFLAALAATPALADTSAARTIADHWPAGKDRFVVRDVSLPTGATVDLALETFTVTRPDTRFVVGGAGGDVALDFDPAAVSLARGHVRGIDGSSVFLASYDGRVTGQIEMDGRVVPVGAPRSDTTPQAGPPPTLCACDDREPAGAAAGVGSPPVTRFPYQKRMEMAVETDFEYFSLFGNANAAAAYVVEMWAATSEIYRREINVAVDLVYVRIWTKPEDLFNEPNPLSFFRNYWNENMQDVERDAAMFVSGRRDLPYGGAAYLNAICNQNGYSVVGYIGGSFPDIDAPSPYNYDVRVVAHELGHNCGTGHTHTYGLDTCDNLSGRPQRGTIMSYCSQTVSGGNGNNELRFHTVCRDAMMGYLGPVDCMDLDCNDNGIPDADEIASGNELDENGDGVPDSCQDCDGNGQLDPEEITNNFALDLNTNGVLDACEADCNGNGVPDDLDIFDHVSVDQNGNGVPDECDFDGDRDDVADHVQIFNDMTVDLDRDLLLDAIEDCDDDGILDLDALEGSNSVWVASHASEGRVHGCLFTTGTVTQLTTKGAATEANDVAITPGGRIFVSSGGDHRVVELDRSGAVIGDFVTAGAGGLVDPGGLLVRDDGHLLVASTGTDAVLEYDASGAYVGDFVAAGAGDLLAPFGLAETAQGDLLVTSDDGRVVRYDAGGAVIGDFVTLEDNGGLVRPRGIVVLTDDRVLVASLATNQILAYASDGAALGQFNQNGTKDALTLDEPWGLRLGPDGLVYVTRHGVHQEGGDGFLDIDWLHINSTRIYVFDPVTGIFLRSHVLGHDTELWEPTGFAFFPDAGVDCNHNSHPDACDIAAGTSADVNGNGVPDECEVLCAGDLDGDGSVNVDDLLTLLGSWGPCWPAVPCVSDFDGDLAVDVDDLLVVLGAWGPCP